MIFDDDDPFAFLGEPLTPRDARSLVPDWFLDQLAAGVTEHQTAHDYAYHLISAFTLPKTMPTVRSRLLDANAFLLRLAEIDPALFDEVICAYAERALIFDQPNAA